ncbi:MAG: 1-deoxy-D-xylulose-5-phosphate synthase N-terminal domain-containing protein [bacterium]
MCKTKTKFDETLYKVKRSIIDMTAGGGCFIGSAFSCADIITFLYTEYMNINKGILKDVNRDYFFLSKGHAVPALYAVLAEAGIIDSIRLKNHLKQNDYIYWHPNTNIEGVEFISGSLGHNLAVAIGVAINSKLNDLNNKIIVLVGDGELNEGTIWESIQIAQAYKLDNLIIIIDRNGIQANEKTEMLIPLDDLTAKFNAFNCAVKIINGHNYEEMKKGFETIPLESKKPSVIIADTVRGWGIKSIENRTDKWFVNTDYNERVNYINELNNYYKN